MDNYLGDLADIVRASGGNGIIGNHTTATATTSDQFGLSNQDSYQLIRNNDAYSFPADTLLRNIDAISTSSTTFLDNMGVDDGGQGGGRLASGADGLVQQVTGPSQTPGIINNGLCNIFSSNNMVQILPDSNNTSHKAIDNNGNNCSSSNNYSDGKLPFLPAAAAASPKVVKSAAAVGYRIMSNQMISMNNASCSSSPKGVFVDGSTTTADVQQLQIPSPRNHGIKRRKIQAKKVVCIPAPAALAANSRQTGEVVPSDLWAWRKYGQKPIKGSPYPRGYYRCSSSKGCSARKQVERSRTDPNMLVITYTSEHNHPWPTQRNALAGSTRSSQPASKTSSKASSPPSQKPSNNKFRNILIKEENENASTTTATTLSTVKEEETKLYDDRLGQFQSTQSNPSKDKVFTLYPSSSSSFSLLHCYTSLKEGEGDIFQFNIFENPINPEKPRSRRTIMTTLQASLLFKPPNYVPLISLSPILRLRPLFSHSFALNYCISRSRKFSISCCALHPQNPHISSNSDSIEKPSSSNSDSFLEFDGKNGDQELENPSISSSSDSGNEETASRIGERESEEENEGFVGEKKGEEGKLAIVVFLVGVWVNFKKKLENIWLSGWLSWWPWQQEKRLQRLIAEADANPNDAALQSSLLAELNKHSPESVIKRFEQRDLAVDSRGVIEYLRALVATNAIAEYLPDEQSGKPSSLPTLLQELKQRASGNTEELSFNPGISEKQPLHVLMVDPKVSNKSSRLAQELFSTLLFTIAVGLVWIMGATALQKYITSLGGIGTSGVGSSSSYSTKELSKEVVPEKNVKTFKDVKGCDDAKQELEEVVEYLKNPAKFTRLGGKLPKGILLTGAPGTGKTLLAKAIAGEAGVPFFYRAGSEFEEMFVGVGARRVRSLFQAAKKKAPCIIFIDEIDAIGSTRKQWEGHTKKTLHQLLVEMDGFEQNEGIILMAATNLPDILDPALTRPGRFDRHIVVPSPDVQGRQDILELYLQDKPVADDVDVKAIARGTPGFNGADLANLVNIAAIKAAVEGAEKLTSSQLEFAKDRILMGTERKTMFITEDSKKLTAYHESGHAIVALNTEGAHPIHKATIIPRGSALGMVTQLPSNDETSVSKRQLLARLDVCMGGRVAEELIFGQDYITTGASSDLNTATELAQYMVTSCGMSDAIGPVHIKERPGSDMQSRIDAEVVKLLRDAYDRVKSLLKKHEKALHALANALLEYETLSSEDIKRILLPYREESQLVEQQEQQEGELVLV